MLLVHNIIIKVDVFGALRNAVHKGGVLGLYRGAFTSIFRVGIGSGAQLLTYSKCRDALHNAGVRLICCLNFIVVCPMNSWSNALAGAMLSGMAVTASMAPFDVLSTRLYNQGVNAQGKGLLYRNLGDCIFKIVKKEGPLALYKGWTAVYLRIGPHSFLCLMFWDILKNLHKDYTRKTKQVA
ncbi:hypothetical protein HAZT_HAZT000354 [Hyalella azteca]|uniref:Uncharacterized protein n=1 Tax=Hyalella azteca TaxID=294128 RepID=A0A6A0GRM2_HYAAZ|nr:hypothetical protein HAZT_HAZT000354 [Hyalella azteca]